MAKEDRVQFRCSSQTRAEWNRMLADIEPMGDKEESVKRILEAYRSNPDLFRSEYR